ncbi:MAG: hypothetical protein HEP71_24025 [Roseivirga sp.]|nr:hypothetical protein [Roseivirga sp.]
MGQTDQLLSREELIQLWHNIATSFDSKLEITVDNGTSLAMRFAFQNEYGQTLVGIKDLAGSGISAGSSMETYVITDLKTTPEEQLVITLPPLFNGLFEKFLTDVSPFYLNTTKHWVKSPSASLREIVSSKKVQGLAGFDSLYLETRENQLILKSNNFLGKAHETKTLINLHLRFLKLISKE